MRIKSWNIRKKIIFIAVTVSAVVLVPLAYAQVANSTKFNDIVGHWAQSSIENLAGLGILGGYPDGTFKPGQGVTRAEVAVIVARSMEQQAEEAKKIVNEKVAFPIERSIAPRRGCPSCHVLADQKTGKYTLAYEAHERVEARGRTHPEVALDGTSLKATDDVRVTTCLQCHAPGTGDRAGKGVVAPLALRDIVHPAHMSSQAFKVHYGGSCFTCHNVAGDGTFELLSEAVDMNEKGVPNPDKMPIPGAIAPSER